MFATLVKRSSSLVNIIPRIGAPSRLLSSGHDGNQPSAGERTDTRPIAPSGFPIGDYPDPIESSAGAEKEEMISQLKNDGGTVQKWHAFGPSSREEPNEVPLPPGEDSRLIICECFPEYPGEPKITWISRWDNDGGPGQKRCHCGRFFKVVDGPKHWSIY